MQIYAAAAVIACHARLGLHIVHLYTTQIIINNNTSGNQGRNQGRQCRQKGEIEKKISPNSGEK